MYSKTRIGLLEAELEAVKRSKNEYRKLLGESRERFIRFFDQPNTKIEVKTRGPFPEFQTMVYEFDGSPSIFATPGEGLKVVHPITKQILLVVHDDAFVSVAVVQ